MSLNLVISVIIPLDTTDLVVKVFANLGVTNAIGSLDDFANIVSNLINLKIF